MPKRLLGQSRRTRFAATFLAGCCVILAACGDDPGPADVDDGDDICSLDQDLLWASLPPDAIPALTLPDMVAPDDIDAAYMRGEDRILGIVVDGEARAYPHNILWHHEIVNDSIGDRWVSISFCPLTGSGLAFDPHVAGTRLDLGVSGLLFANNLVMYDRISGGIFGPQLERTGKCTSFRDTQLESVAVQEMSWARWQSLYPDTKVVGSDTGFSREYTVYPYGTYDLLADSDLLFPMPVDLSRAIKERVLAIRTGEEEGRGYPFLELQAMGDVVALNEDVDGIPTAVFFEAQEGQSAFAFDARVGSQTLTFEALSSGLFRDQETGTSWRIDGVAVEGPLEGDRLAQHAESFVLFWFAWRQFMPNGSTFLAP